MFHSEFRLAEDRGPEASGAAASRRAGHTGQQTRRPGPRSRRTGKRVCPHLSLSLALFFSLCLPAMHSGIADPGQDVQVPRRSFPITFGSPELVKSCVFTFTHFVFRGHVGM